MCDYFDDFDGKFMDDGFDDGEFGDDMEDSLDPNLDDDLAQDGNQSDGLTWDDAYWSGVGLGFWYDEGRRERWKRKKHDSHNPDEFP